MPRGGGKWAQGVRRADGEREWTSGHLRATTGRSKRTPDAFAHGSDPIGPPRVFVLS